MSLATLVLSLADNKQLLGLRYAEWATRGPSLEADIAAAAMGLDDIGHSRVLYGCLEPLGEDPRAALDREGDPASYLIVPYLDQPWEAWSQFVAANAVLDSAFTAVIQACVEGSVDILQQRLRKMLAEERYHFLHGRSWLRSEVDQGHLVEAWRQAVEWIGPPDGELEQLHQEGKLSAGPGELLNRIGQRLEADLPTVGVNWSGWDPVRRRTRPGALDERTFGMLRGLEEKRFMPARAGASA
ncbi:MAG TPA: Phenylacetic acid catabolic protein [Candidatus Dormibacteraeota bacterium]